jgi:DNA repair exonuclease SbcCD ATPase subunit
MELSGHLCAAMVRGTRSPPGWGRLARAGLAAPLSRREAWPWRLQPGLRPARGPRPRRQPKECGHEHHQPPPRAGPPPRRCHPSPPQEENRALKRRAEELEASLAEAREGGEREAKRRLAAGRALAEASRELQRYGDLLRAGEARVAELERALQQQQQQQQKEEERHEQQEEEQGQRQEEQQQKGQQQQQQQQPEPGPAQGPDGYTVLQEGDTAILVID